MKTRLRVNFTSPITGNDLRMIHSMYQNEFSARETNMQYIINVMRDTEICEIEYINEMSETEQVFLKGLFYGYLRNNMISFRKLDKYGCVVG